jgi:hypothetical protein
MERTQFVEMALGHFQQFGFITVGNDFGEATLHQIVPNPEPEQPDRIVTRMIDSWGQESVEPQTQALERTELTPDIAHYVPRDALTPGLYLISVRPGEGEPAAMYPIALEAPDR